MGVANLSGRDSIPLAIWNRTIIVVSTAQLFNYFALSTHARAYAAVNATVPIFTFQAVLGEKKKTEVDKPSNAGIYRGARTPREEILNVPAFG